MPSKLRRTQSVQVELESSASEETESEDSEMEDTNRLWELAEDSVLDMVEGVKKRLEIIAPGIGDRITLAKFANFVQENSTSLE
tara:strand:- start:237 stop:488 length:252 start_codon:yes stop_codon:yes gene_type:complete